MSKQDDDLMEKFVGVTWSGLIIFYSVLIILLIIFGLSALFEG